MQMVGHILVLLAVALIPVMFVGIVGHLIASEVLFYRLRLWHPDYYEAIGRPSLLNSRFTRSGKAKRYVIDRDFIEVPDDRIIRLGDLARRLGEAGMAACIAMPIAAFFGLALS